MLWGTFTLTLFFFWVPKSFNLIGSHFTLNCASEQSLIRRSSVIDNHTTKVKNIHNLMCLVADCLNEVVKEIIVYTSCNYQLNSCQQLPGVDLLLVVQYCKLFSGSQLPNSVTDGQSVQNRLFFLIKKDLKIVFLSGPGPWFCFYSVLDNYTFAFQQ